jgi:uncharacterized protein (DUF924 family)
MPSKRSSSSPDAIINYWLGSSDSNPAAFAAQQKLWYDSRAETDNHIRTTFGSDLASAEKGDLVHWMNTPEGSLALVILLDQFSRNLYRGTPAVYANDIQAQDVVHSLLEKDGQPLPGKDRALHFNIPARIIFYHPLHHAENLNLQEKAVSLFEEMLESAPDEWRETVAGNLAFIKSHCDIIRKFGRFPHRNKILDRLSTPEECQYLEQDKRTYGQQ